MSIDYLLGGHTPFRRNVGQVLFWAAPANRRQEDEHPENHGYPWSDMDVESLLRQWAGGADVATLAAQLKRKPSAVVGKLKTRGILAREDYQSPYRVTRQGEQELLSRVSKSSNPKPAEPTFNRETYAFTTKEIDMTTTAPTIENRTFIDGTDATQLSDDQIINRLVKLASTAADIEKVLPWMPNGEAREVLIRRQQGLRAGLVELSGYFDDRKSSESAQAVADAD